MSDVAIRIENGDLLMPINISPPAARAIAFIETIFVAFFVILGLLEYGRPDPKVLNLSPRYDIHVVIPHYFVLALFSGRDGSYYHLNRLARMGGWAWSVLVSLY
jgi:hypothetical protein